MASVSQYLTRALAALLLLAAPAVAQFPLGGGGAAQDTAAAPPATASGEVDPRSPRAAILEYLILTRRGDFGSAARFLGSGVPDDRAPELARRLKAVLDQHLWVELELVSPLAVGDTTDGLPRGVDQIGTVPGPDGGREPVQLARMPAESDPAWVFAPITVSRIDDWYDNLGDRWLRERMPVALLQPGPFGIEYWQWLALLVLFPVAMIIGWFAGRGTLFVFRRAVRHTETTLDDRILERTRGPVLGLWAVAVYWALVAFVGLSIGALQVVSWLARVTAIVLVIWMVMRALRVLQDEVPSAPWTAAHPGIRALVPLITAVLRILLLAIGAITIVAQFGVNVMTLVAGLGIGGIALALAAQKSLEHMFGSVAIGLDQPIRVGDFVNADGTLGAVEEVGLRSTRIRTLDRSVVTIPNGRLAEMKMENFALRDRFLLRTTIGLEYGTTEAQLRQVRDGFLQVLRDYPLVWQDSITVRFAAFSAYSMDIEIMAWITSTDIAIFREAREDIFFRFMKVVEEAGGSFAFPTQTIHVKQ